MNWELVQSQVAGPHPWSLWLAGLGPNPGISVSKSFQEMLMLLSLGTVFWEELIRSICRSGSSSSGWFSLSWCLCFRVLIWFWQKATHYPCLFLFAYLFIYFWKGEGILGAWDKGAFMKKGFVFAFARFLGTLADHSRLNSCLEVFWKA